MVDKKKQKRSGNPILKFINHLIRSIPGLFQPKKKLIGASWQDVKLEISAEVNRYLEMRHVLEDEIKQVIYHGETTGEKLYQPEANRYLAKLKIGKVTFYADYSYGDEKFIVQYGYAHRSEIMG
jgi:hypothetical protein